mmetsp:Transcript_4523/g.4667  ORF Transcript_4523/g.4667 Transcript_4523/m.4667 type:complete len:622 (-) Transcript_4523:318-2183(-)
MLLSLPQPFATLTQSSFPPNSTTQFVLSHESHSLEYTCPICQHLVELDCSTTSCSHVFCSSCITQWLSHALRCPTCNKDISENSVNKANVQLLSVAQPLAFRVLKRVRVSCPHSVNGCSWEGDYGDLHSHLIDSGVHNTEGLQQQQQNNGGSSPKLSSAATPLSKESIAKTFKEQADDKFGAGSYKEAMELYAGALSAFPQPNLYNNRAAAALMIKDFASCLADCDAAISMDPKYAKAYLRKCKAALEIGKFSVCCLTIEEACKECPDNSELANQCYRYKEIYNQVQLGEKQLTEKDFSGARTTFGSLLRETNCSLIVLSAARAELGLGLTDRALRLTLQVLRTDRGCSEAYSVRGQVLYYVGDFDQATKLMREGLRMDPDDSRSREAFKKMRNVETKLKEARNLVFVRKFADALTKYNETFSVCCNDLPPKSQLNAMLHAERGNVLLRLNMFEECIRDCSIAIYAKDDLVEAWVTKARALQGLDKVEEAQDELTPLMHKWGHGEPKIRAAYESAVFLVKKKNRVDYYKLLNIPSVCSEMEIKKQYKVKALELHPDRWSNAEFTDEQRKEAENKFKDIGNALEVLCDPQRRQLFDEGYDREAIEERIQRAQRAAHHGHGHG